MSEPGLFEHVCRTCLSTNGELVSIFPEDFYVRNLPEKLMAFTSIKISDQDFLPKKMCKKCIFLTDLLHCFKEQCESAERRLRSHLKGNAKLCLEKYHEIDKFPDGTKLVDTLEPNIVINNSKEDTENTIKKENQVSIKAMSLNGKDEIAAEAESANEKFKSKEKYHPLISIIHLPWKNDEVDNCQEVCRGKIPNESVKDTATFQTKLMHTNEKPNTPAKSSMYYQCTACIINFASLPNILRHIIQTHTPDQNLYPCVVCDRIFENKSFLTAHVEDHTNFKAYQCTFCSQTFSLRRNLKRHIDHHINYKLYHCTMCSQQFSEKKYLSAHMHLHTGYPCPRCSKTFSHPSNLKRHINSHLNDRRFLCSYCGKGFNQSGTRNNHILTHTGEKPYQCSHCDARFTVSFTLKRHMKTHLKKSQTIPLRKM